MAPSRKKNKKPISNPARGFATTSVVSKGVADNQPSNPEKESIALGDTTTSSQGIVDVPSPTGHNEPKEITELTPDELEAQLEESDLQVFVEQYGPKSKKDASRYISKLQTERRILRNQAERLHLAGWLPDELAERIIHSLRAPYVNGSQKVSEKRGLVSRNLSSDDSISKLWTLKQALVGLGFSEASSTGAIESLIGNPAAIEKADQSFGREGVWGLDECLEWLALFCIGDELPEYDNLPRSKDEKFPAHTALNEGHWALDTIDTRSGSGTSTPSNTVSDCKLPLEHESLMPEAKAVDLGPDPDDLEPYEMLDYYLRMKSLLYEINPSLTDVGSKKGKQSKARKEPMEFGLDKNAKVILRRLRAIESDILFDIDDAREKWAETRLGLIRETAERHKSSGHETQRDGQDQKPVSNIETLRGEKNEEESAIDLGDFFSSLPEQTIQEAGGFDQLTVTSTNGSKVTVRDFGKWSGMSPRRVLEDACKARDPSSKVSLSAVSASSFSHRQSLLIKWSRAQRISQETVIPGVLAQSNARNASVEMVNISTPDAAQSEAYISTVALFYVFAGSPKEEKAYLRLPAVWRDLWNEFSDAHQNQVNIIDREQIRNLRKLVEESSRNMEVELKEGPRENAIKVDAKSRYQQDSTASSDCSMADPDLVKRLWASKVSSPAYTRMLQSRMNLPIWHFKQQLLDAIENHQAIIVCGETGCGKSTQVPAFILESELSRGRDCRVYCTEPRRISAISLARRVSQELGEHRNDVGTSRSVVGFAIRLENQVTANTRLVYATTGIVMRMLEKADGLRGITHIVLDEVHERTIDSDFLLIILKKLMVKRPGLKLILMSATVKAEKFSRYLEGAPIMTVPGRTFPVDTKYLEDAVEATNYAMGSDMMAENGMDLTLDEDPLEEARQSTASIEIQGYSARTRNVLVELDEYRIDYELIVQLLVTIATKKSYVNYSKAVLVFLPGLAEIRRLNDMLAGHPTFSHGWQVFPLHSTIATDEQEEAFLIPPEGYRKIVLATNIAETGITIPDVTCVIDSGKHKEMRFDERRQLSRLVESFISRANANQRRGRAGRVQDGLCFHLFTRARYDNLMAAEQTPEMLRLSLQDLSLRVKICKLGGIEETLTQALDSPLPKNIRRAIDSLIDAKALTQGEELTALGRQLAKLPLDVYLGKLVLLSRIFNCLDAGLTIAALLSSKSPFVTPIAARAQADLARLAFKRGDSDLLTMYNAYSSWRRVCNSSNSSEFQFCRKNFLSPQTLSNVEDLKAQLTMSLVDAGFLVLNDSGKIALNKARAYTRKTHFVELPGSVDDNTNNDLVLNSIVAWSFFPKILTRDGKGWRNIANNQTVSLHPTSVSKSLGGAQKWLSFYHIMQSSTRFYNAHETSPVEDFALALVCGEADFKMYSGVIIIDGNRLRFSVPNWRSMILFKALRSQIREITVQSFRYPGKPLSESQSFWFGIWQAIFTQKGKHQD